MKPQLRYFRSLVSLTSLIEEYFNGVGIDARIMAPKSKVKTLSKTTAKRTTARRKKAEPEPPTITGLALHLGFNSLEEFEQYEKQGKYPFALKRARLLIAASYEKKLHNSHHGGAVFALKEMGWHERSETKSLGENTPVITIKIIESGPEPASAEKDIPLWNDARHQFI